MRKFVLSVLVLIIFVFLVLHPFVWTLADGVIPVH